MLAISTGAVRIHCKQLANSCIDDVLRHALQFDLLTQHVIEPLALAGPLKLDDLYTALQV